MGRPGLVAGGLIARGEIWTYEFNPPDKRRPVLVLTRDEAIPYLNALMVAPITSTMRGSPAEVPVGVDEGLKHASAANLDQVQTVAKQRLRKYVGRLGPAKMQSVCRALAIATGCDG